jgi:transposase
VHVAAANAAETTMGLVVLTLALVTLPGTPDAPTPVLADRCYDSDPLRVLLASMGFVLVSKHRSNRVQDATSDGRRELRLKRRWKVERSNAWLHSYRRALTRYEKSFERYCGFVSLACAFMAIGKLMK